MEVKIMSLGNHLFQARKKAGYSQEAVAERLGVSRQTISKWETEVSQTKRY
jgi:Predicted transcriptional regulators